jgi:WD40 repeat protein/uncharacterized caspase-like protein
MRSLLKKLVLAFLSSVVVFNLTSYAQKAELVVQTGHTDKPLFVAFSPDGKYLASSNHMHTTKLWNIATGQEVRTFAGGGAVFSPDGKTMATIGLGIKLWDWRTGQELRTIQASLSITRVAFSPKGDVVASVDTIINTIKLWDAATGRQLRTLAGHTGMIGSVTFSPDGKTLASDSMDQTVKLWNWQTGAQLRTIQAWIISDSFSNSLVFSPNGETIAGFVVAGKLTLWDVATGQQLREFGELQMPGFNSLSFSLHGKAIAIIDRSFNFTVSSRPTRSRADVGGSRTIKLFDVRTGQELQSIESREKLQTFEFSPDEKILVIIGEDNNPKLLDAATGQQVRALAGYAAQISTAGSSVDGNVLASGNADGSIRLWDVQKGQQLRTLKGHDSYVKQIVFSQDGKTLASGSEDNIIKLWNVETGRELKSLPINDPATQRQIESAVPAFYQTTPFETAVIGGKFKIYQGEGGKLNIHEGDSATPSVSLISLNENDWVVITPEGLFDASKEARRLMHYVAGLEPVGLEQMKDVYYVPGLLRKIFRGEPLPKVELFAAQDLFPSVEYEPLNPNQKQLIVKLTNRGGGIGRVQVLFNGKELIADARPAGLNPNAPNATIAVDLSKAAVKVGEENRIEVVARNAADSLSTRGVRGAELIFTDGGRKQTGLPNIYAIVGGISYYTGDDLRLSFAAKDAEDFARVLELGALKLMNGDKSKVHIRLLTSNGDKSNVKFNSPDAKVSTAAKADFAQAFADFRDATTNDVFIVYLAGHGVSLNLNQNSARAGGDTYLYLTQEATTTDKTLLAVENSRKAMALSSEELKDLMKQNKALKQVLILDTCAAGALSNSLVAQRDLPSDQIRAIERLKDSTGFFVLMGAAADAVSYEASQYGQGLLTYSLLQGMKGARLRENQFADVGMLFNYAQDAVPAMAKNIGGIQRPLVITPDASRSFDIGEFTAEEQRQIVLSSLKPVFLSPTLLSGKNKRDDQNLTQLLKQELRELGHAGTTIGRVAQLVFVEADKMADAIMLSGLYTIEGDRLTVNVVLSRNEAQFGKEIIVTGKAAEKEQVIKRLVAEIIKAAQ